ncbi:hypothetical protein [Acanthamoeba polyphaga mimivirus]|uniref:Uncharacterized protein n=1 Tax=Acanthamoeba polyphaga mimivirus TaxID=212035 RepID=A0A2L2DKR2_MIMIV|nr:hypothetical protein [Acanthamoeba polyphaga mimivirus]
METTSVIQEYFVFVVYDKYYPSNAIFINTTKNKDNDLTTKMNQLISIGNQITSDIENDKYIVNNTIINSENETIINYWRSLLSVLEHDHESDQFSNHFYECCYYMYLNKPKYRSLSPEQLQNKLSSKQTIQSNPIKVANCVMVSEIGFVPIDPTIVIRYFVYGGTINNDIIAQIAKLPGVKSIQPAKKSDDIFANYGYIKIDDKFVNDFIGKEIYFGDLKIQFDHC